MSEKNFEQCFVEDLGEKLIMSVQQFCFLNDFTSFYNCITENAFSEPPSIICLETNERIIKSEVSNINRFCKIHNSRVIFFRILPGESSLTKTILKVKTNITCIKKE